MNSLNVSKKRLEYILGDQYELLKKSEAILAGGCITSLITGTEINDFDLYFRSKAHLSTQLAGMFSKEFGYYQLHHLTNKALMYIARDEENLCQLIAFDFFEDAHAVFDRFDFTVNMAAFDFKTEEFVFHERFWQDVAARNLFINVKTDYPIITSLRVEKYEKKGFTISKAQHLKLMLAISRMKIDSWEQLRDQVGGMYGYSFEEIFSDQDGQDFSIDAAIEKIEALSYGREMRLNKAQEFSGNDPDISEIMEKWKDILHESQVKWYTDQNTEYKNWVGDIAIRNSSDDGGSEWLDSVTITEKHNPFDRDENETN